MRARKLLVMAGALAALASPAFAQTDPNAHGPFDTNQPQTAPQGTPSAPYFYKAQGYTSAAAITPGTAFPASVAIGYVVTTAGTVTVTMAGGGTVTFPVAATTTLQMLPLSITNITLGTAVGTFWSMK